MRDITKEKVLRVSDMIEELKKFPGDAIFLWPLHSYHREGDPISGFKLVKAEDSRYEPMRRVYVTCSEYEYFPQLRERYTVDAVIPEA